MKAMNCFLLVVAILTSTAVAARTGPPDPQKALDSLYAIWQDDARADSTRANAYEKYIAQGFLENDPDSAFALAEELLKFGERRQYPMAKAQAYSLQGSSFDVREKYDEALDHAQRSLKIYEAIGERDRITTPLKTLGLVYAKQGNYPRALAFQQRSLAISEERGDKRRMASTLNNIGNIHYYQGNYPQAIGYYQRSLKVGEELEDEHSISTSLNNIGSIYGGQGDYSKALEYFLRDLKDREELGDKSGIAASLNNIGNVYTNQGKLKEALEQFQRGVAILESISDKRDLNSLLLNIGTNYMNQGDFPRALEYYQRSLKLTEASGDKYGIIYGLLCIGLAYKHQGMYAQAISECQRALDVSMEIGMIPTQKEACSCLYEAYKGMGNGDKALAYHERMLLLQDSLNARKTTEKLQQMEFQKVMLADSLQQQKERMKVEDAHQREVTKKNKVRNLLMGGGLLFLALAVGFYGRWRYTKRSKDAISKERDRSDNLLLNILPAEIAAELKEKGEAQARDFELVSILFTDFKDFTRASEKLTATDLVAEINTCFMAFDGIVGKYKIEKIKTIGDAYMCAGGLPVPDESSVKNTVLAGLEMQAFMQRRKVERDAAGLPAFEMRVGIHTGPVVAGIVGVKKFQYDIWGDTVNTANRMESSGEVGQVNISGATYDLVREVKEVRDASAPLSTGGMEVPVFSFTPRGKVEAKGKGEMEMYFVSRSLA